MIEVLRLFNDAGWVVTVYAKVGGRHLSAFSRVNAREFEMDGLYRGLTRATRSLLRRGGVR